METFRIQSWGTKANDDIYFCIIFKLVQLKTKSCAFKCVLIMGVKIETLGLAILSLTVS